MGISTQGQGRKDSMRRKLTKETKEKAGKDEEVNRDGRKLIEFIEEEGWTI